MINNGYVASSSFHGGALGASQGSLLHEFQNSSGQMIEKGVSMTSSA